MSTVTLNEREYQRLLGQALPVVIQTEDEYARMLAAVRELMDKGENQLSEEEGRLVELLAVLVEEYEDRVHPLPKGEPRKMLASLLEEKGMKPRDLWSVLPKSRVSEILSGKRAISKAQAKKLSEFFHVPADLFL
ncbi:MAG: transcriptional regulator [Acidobacteriia bacterium]|nr:transcriptional regulator [Terriglobia bacterium]